MDTQVITKKLIEISLKKPLSPDDQILLFVFARQLLEIDRDHECGPIISKISKSLFIMEQCQTTLSGVISILKSLLFRELIAQFHQLFSKYSIFTIIFEFPDYVHFLNQLISNLLIDKPLTLKLDKKTQKHFQKHFNDITNRTRGKEIMAIKSIYFHFYLNYTDPNSQNSSAVCAVCENRNEAKIIIPIEFDLWRVVLEKETNFDVMLCS